MEKKDLSYKLLSFIIIAAVFSATAVFVMGAVPIGPSTFTEGLSETLDIGNYPAGEQDAYAGNITQITIDTNSQTKHWQGYYGDITGTIVLDDASNYTLYDWPNAEPKGEIYATVNDSTIDWANMICFNFTGGYGGVWNLTDWEDRYNMTYNDVDGIDETFNMTQHEAIDIGDVITILEDTCPSTYMHINDTFQENKFSEVLLQDSNGMLVFTTIIENDDTANNTDIQGYKGTTFEPDFQMLVAEDGTSRTGGQINTATTRYYFYVDLE